MAEAKNIVQIPQNPFFRVKCHSCSNEQIIYSAASTKVNCLVCGNVLAETGASRIQLKTKPLKELR